MSASEIFLALFPGFSPLMPVVRFRTYEAGSFIVREEDPIDTLSFILSGNAWVVQHLANGKAHLYQVSSPGDIVGDVEYYLGCSATCSVQCMSEVVLAAIPYRSIGSGGISTEVDRPLAAALAAKLRSSSFSAARNTGFSLIHRLAHYLCTSGFDVVPNCRMEEISELLGTTRRHLRRVISQLEASGALQREKGGLVVKQREILEELSCEIDP